MQYLELRARKIAQFMHKEEFPFWQIEAIMEIRKIPLQYRDKFKKIIIEELSELKQQK